MKPTHYLINHDGTKQPCVIVTTAYNEEMENDNEKFLSKTLKDRQALSITDYGNSFQKNCVSFHFKVNNHLQRLGYFDKNKYTLIDLISEKYIGYRGSQFMRTVPTKYLRKMSIIDRLLWKDQRT